MRSSPGAASRGPLRPPHVAEPEPIPLARPDLGAREEEMVLEAMRSGRLSLGPMLDLFERRFAEWLGVDDSVAVSSGTSALHLGVRALGWGPGDEVVTSPFSFAASANCLLYEGATPVFCDIDPVTLNLDPAGAALGERTAGLLPVHILGYPAAMPELEGIAAKHGLGILEDACEAAGAVDSEGVSVGARGNLATFAFYANKQLTTGEGGMIIPSEPETAARLRSERNQGRAEDMGWLSHERLGFNYRLTELQAAIGVAQLERADELLADRSRVAGLYAQRLEAIGASGAGEGDPEGLVLPCRDRGSERRSWFIYALLLPRGADRDSLVAALGAQGIQAKAYMPCIHLMPHYRQRFGFREGQFPNAEDASARLLALPFFGGMGEMEVDRVAAALAAALGRGAGG
jgi:perosamine synthetase